MLWFYYSTMTKLIFFSGYIFFSLFGRFSIDEYWRIYMSHRMCECVHSPVCVIVFICVCMCECMRTCICASLCACVSVSLCTEKANESPVVFVVSLSLDCTSSRVWSERSTYPSALKWKNDRNSIFSMREDRTNCRMLLTYSAPR